MPESEEEARIGGWLPGVQENATGYTAGLSVLCFCPGSHLLPWPHSRSRLQLIPTTCYVCILILRPCLCLCLFLSSFFPFKTKFYYISPARFLCSSSWSELIGLLPQTLEHGIIKVHHHARLLLTSKSTSLTQISFFPCALDASCQKFPSGCSSGFRN